MTRKIFWDDPYRTSVAAKVTLVNGPEVILDGTIFFAFAGGQERDHGTIGGRDVLDARWEGPDIVYRLRPRHGLVGGDGVIIAIDAERRARLRRLHMATEIVLELLTQTDPTLVKIGAHMSAERGRIDFATPNSLRDQLPEIEAAANELVAQDLAILRRFFEDSETRRYWEIAGFARVACGGTLPARTGEVGQLRLRRRNPGKGKERVEIEIVEA